MEDEAAVRDRAPTSALLMSISKHVAVRCAKVNKAFIDCKKRDKNPEACLSEGEAVTICVVDLIKDLRSKAPSELKAYYECMDYHSNKFDKCRKQQAAFEEFVPVS